MLLQYHPKKTYLLYSVGINVPEQTLIHSWYVHWSAIFLYTMIEKISKYMNGSPYMGYTSWMMNLKSWGISKALWLRKTKSQSRSPIHAIQVLLLSKLFQPLQLQLQWWPSHQLLILHRFGGGKTYEVECGWYRTMFHGCWLNVESRSQPIRL